MMALTAVTILALSSCGTTQQVPLTGRTHRISVSDEQVLSLSNQEYTKYMASAKKSTNAANTAMVQRVGKKLANAVETYLKNNGFANDVKNYAWEFNLVQDKNVNAFCMPGGKIVVFEGLLPYTQNETCLAIVLGHEIAHAVAKHSAEQLSKQQNHQSVHRCFLYVGHFLFRENQPALFGGVIGDVEGSGGHCSVHACRETGGLPVVFGMDNPVTALVNFLLPALGVRSCRRCVWS